MSGDSYDNTRRLDGTHWRHVKFIEQFNEDRSDGRWLMMSDVCKHCVNAPCLEVCPTGAIIRTEFDTVVIQSDTCNGCRACIGACPFGVIGINDVSNVAQKCTLCYDRLQAGLEPACSQACPTDSIRFGPIRELKQTAAERLEQLHQQGEQRAYLYGADDKFLGGLNSFYLLVDRPEVYGLPVSPKMPTRNLIPSSLFSSAGAVVIALLGLVGLRKRRMDDPSLRSGQAPSASLGQALRVGQVHHFPYPLQEAAAQVREAATLLQADGLPAPSGEPHVLFSPGVDVEVFPLRRP
jgi:formate dehydrogenase iron-sulfur subunit